MKAKILFGGKIENLSRGELNKEVLADELHKEFRKPKEYLKVKVFNKDDIWSADLIFMPKERSKERSNVQSFKIILTVIDLYTRYAWAIPLKDKTGKTIVDAFEEIFELNERVPNKLWVDNGSEFYNKVFKKFLEDNKIEMYSTFNEGKAVVIERFNRTLKQMMWKEFTIQGNQKWLLLLPKLIDKYNNKIHSSIGVSPNEASENPGIFHEPKSKTKSKPKFKVGDRVRIFKYKYKFDKGYTAKWTNEIFKISEVINSGKSQDPIVYRIKALDNEEILGRFYQNELQKTSF